MGVRGELFSTKVSLQNRTYFFNVKENRLGDFYLNIVESKNRDEGGFDRQSVILFAEDLQDFLQGFDESLKVLEKAVREKRRSPTKKIQVQEQKGRFPAGGKEHKKKEKPFGKTQVKGPRQQGQSSRQGQNPKQGRLGLSKPGPNKPGPGKPGLNRPGPKRKIVVKKTFKDE